MSTIALSEDGNHLSFSGDKLSGEGISADDKEQLQMEGLNRITEGDNVVSNSLGQMGYKAHQDGWSPCTGLGSPNGEKLLAELLNVPGLISSASEVTEKI